VPNEPLKSPLLGVEMPDGSTFEQGLDHPHDEHTGQEFWLVPGNLTDVTAKMHSRLPINGDLGDIPWCSAQNDPSGGATWH
jgi:hypothetical protein